MSERIGLPDGSRPQTDEGAAIFRFVEDPSPGRVPDQAVVIEANSAVIYELIDHKTDLLTKKNGRPVDYVSTEQSTDFSWGASGLGFAWLVDIGSGLLVQEVVERIRKLLAHRSEPRQLPLEEAVGIARQAIARVYTVGALDLDHVGERSSPTRGVVTVVLESEEEVFEVEVEPVGTIHLSNHITRRRKS